MVVELNNSKTKKSGHSRFDYVTNKNKAISRPSQSVLQRWLRDTHRINVLISFKPNVKKWDFITSDMNLSGTEWVKYYTKYYYDKMTRRYDSYELALEDALIEGMEKI